MNKERKERFDIVVAILYEAIDELDSIRYEEQDALDALPEGLQMSSKGDEMQEYIDLMSKSMRKIELNISFIEKQIISKK